MTKDEAVKTIGLYRGKVEKIEKKIRYIQAQQEYRDEISFGYYLQNIDYLIFNIGLNLECLETTIDRTLALYQEGFICQTERYIEEDTKIEIKKVRKYLREIDELLEKAVTEKHIDFEEWGDMPLYSGENIFVDFSQTNANLDFSIIESQLDKAFSNLKGCKIKNFNFTTLNYAAQMFDEEFIKENEEHFLSDNIPEDVANRFYTGMISLTDIKNNPELANKIEEQNLEYSLRYIYKIIGREEFCKLDAEFIDDSAYLWGNAWDTSVSFLDLNPNLRTAEEIMPALYEEARRRIIAYNRGDRTSYINPQDELGEIFKKQNADLFLSEEVPEDVRRDYYRHNLSLKDFSENLQYFE